MTISYTALLGLAQPVTGTETGQWGTVVNDEITALLEDAVANAASISVTAGNVTLSTTNGSSNQARMSTLIITGTPGTTRNVVAPSQAKIYVVINQSDGAVVIKGAATSGVTIGAGQTAQVAWNGSDFVEIGNYVHGNFVVNGNLSVNGDSTLGNAGADTTTINGQVIAANSNISKTTTLSASAPALAWIKGATYTDTGTAGGTTQALAPFTVFSTPTLSTSNIVTYTDAATVYIAGAPAAAGSATITNPYSLYVAAGNAYFGASVSATTLDLTNLEVTNIKAKDGTASMTLADSTGVATFSANPIINAGTANGVPYLNGSKVLTTGSALTFDGSEIFKNSGGTIQNNDVRGSAAAGTRLSAGGTLGVDSFDLFQNAVGGYVFNRGNTPLIFGANNAEKMRLTSTGTLNIVGAGTAGSTQAISFNGSTPVDTLVTDSSGRVGIGTSSPNAKLTVGDSSGAVLGIPTTASFYGTSSISSSVGTVGLFSTEASAVGVGPTLTFGGKSGNSFSPYPYAFIQGCKASATAGDYSGFLRFWTVPSDGGSPIERLRIDSSGNLGLGVTPSAWTVYKALQVNGAVFANSGVGTAFIGSNWFYDGADKYIASNYATIYRQNAGVHSWLIAPSGTAGATTSITSGVAYSVTTLGSTTLGQWQAYFSALGSIPSIGQTVTATATGTLAGGATVTQIAVFTQAMTLDASGRLGVGETSPAAVIHANAAGGGSIRASRSTVSSEYIQMDHDGSDGSLRVSGAYAMLFHTNGGERARITSGGYFKASNTGSYVGSTGTYHEMVSNDNNTLVVRNSSTSTVTDGTIFISNARNTTDNTYYIICAYNSTTNLFRFRVADSGDVTNTNNSYGAISDQKMKTDIVDAGSQWSDIKALRFRKFKMKDDPSGRVQLGVVAQEVELTSPGLVDEHQDRDAEGNDLGTTTKSVKTSVLLMKAAVALQEAMARIETLEAKIAVLESKGV
jgi:hypothetical protein